jgi:DNA-binding NarL/FixJ family response regulator
MRVMMADDESAVCSALRLLLEQEPGVSIVGETPQADELLAQVASNCPDLLLLDWELPGRRAGCGGRSRRGLLHALHLACPQLKVIVLSGRPEAHCAALAAGADAFVSKGDPPEHLLAAIARCRRPAQGGFGT